METQAGVRLMGSDRFEDLYATHSQRATRLAYLMCGDRDLAQDLVQEAFIRVAGRFQELRGTDSFGAYLDRVVVNLVRDQHRRRSVEKRWLRRGRKEDAVEAAYDPSDRSSLLQSLGKLPTRQRAAVVLRYYEDLSERQVADVLNVSHGAARSLISRGMATLRTHLEGDRDE